MKRTVKGFLALLALFAGGVLQADDGALEAGFREPPHRAGIRCFWWWLNGNVTREAITRDLEEMKAKGFSGALIFDADGSGQQGKGRVPAGPVFGGPEWTELFVHACREAKRLDLELSLNIQSGWNLGGPKVSAAEAAQRLVWSKTGVHGPARFKQQLPLPRHKDFYRDVAVIAVPIAGPPEAGSGGADSGPTCSIQASSSQSAYPPARAMDGDPGTFWVSEQPPSPEQPQSLLLKLSEPVELSELSLRGREGFGPKACVIEVSADNQSFAAVTRAELRDGETLEAGFPKQRVQSMRMLFTSAYDVGSSTGPARNVQVAEIAVPGVTGPIVAEARTKRPVKNLALKRATRRVGRSAPDCRFLLQSAPAQPGELKIRPEAILDLSDRLQDDGTLAWEVPAGEWEILRFGHTPCEGHVSTHSQGWGGRVLDYLNPASLDAYWNRNIEPLIEAIGPLAGSTLRYIHTDSWEGGGMNWTPGFEGTFQKNRGYDPIPWLAVLTGHIVEDREASNAFLADFRKTIADLVADHYGQMAAISKRHGMATHPECSGPHAGPMDGLKNYGRSELMMSEFWSPSSHRPKHDDRFFVKQASSAAHTYGKRLVGAEGFTTIGPHWNDIPWAHMKPSFDTELCAGLNLLFVHTFTCSPREMGLPGQEYFAGTHFNPQITWWEEAPAFIDYLRRCQFLTQQGSFVADVLHYYGDHIPNIFGRKGHDPADALPGYDYDVLNEELLLGPLEVRDGQLVLPSGSSPPKPEGRRGMTYRVLTLPDHRILSLGALEKIDALVRAGATVLGPKPLKAVSLSGGPDRAARFRQLADGLWGGNPPAQEAGIREVGQGRIAWGMTARELLPRIGVEPDVEITAAEGDTAGLDWIHYRIGDADLYFLAELAGKARRIEAGFRAGGRIPELWDAVDGSIREANAFASSAGRTRVPLSLGRYDSLFVVFRQPTSEDQRDRGPNAPSWEAVQDLAGPWDVSFDPEWGGPAQPVRFETLTDWWDHPDPAIKFYAGRATYRTIFELQGDPPGKTGALELGEVRGVGIARARLNGADLGISWRPPFRFAVPEGAFKPGRNTLEVTAINSWYNRILGDQGLPKDQRFTQTNIQAQKSGKRKWSHEPSGLTGPVRIVHQVPDANQ